MVKIRPFICPHIAWPRDKGCSAFFLPKINIMKKSIQLIFLTVSLALFGAQADGQAWERHTNTLSIGFGASQFFHLDNYYYNGNGNPRLYQNWYTPLTGQFNFQGEFGIHKYWGLGFTTGVGGRGGWNYNYAGELNIPIGMIANFHFYQLISDKNQKHKNIHADKLDIYVGASLGGGVAFTYYPYETRIVPMAFGGLHAGIRYYFTKRVGVNGELGWGKSLINVGFVFKL